MRGSKYKKIIMGIAVFLSALQISAYADDVNELQKQLDSKNTEIANQEAAVQELESRKRVLTQGVMEANSDIQELQSQLDALNERVLAVTEEYNAAKREEEKQKNIFYKRLVVLYEKGNIAYMEALLESKDIMEISKRSEYMRQISEHDKKIFSDYAASRQEVESRKNELDAITADCQAKKEELDQKVAQMNGEISTIDAELHDRSQSLIALNEEKNVINKKIYKLSYAGRIFAEGEKYLGFPYVWGGSTPETSFDCSGFVCWTYTNSGVYNLPRTTAQGIYDQCKKISASEAREGDLVFFTNTYESAEPVTHIGIYAGNGEMLHCGNPIKYASIQTPYWQSHFYAYGRLE